MESELRSAVEDALGRRRQQSLAEQGSWCPSLGSGPRLPHQEDDHLLPLSVTAAYFSDIFYHKSAFCLTFLLALALVLDRKFV